jgi:hypothetical protein
MMLSLLNLLRALPLEVIQLFYQQTFLLRADGGTAGVAGLSGIALTESDRQVRLGTDLLINTLTDARGPLVASSQASSPKSSRERIGLL